MADAHRREWASVLASTARLTRDLDLAEECTQDAYARALVSWAQDGIPRRPGAWLTTVAANRARDVIRREATLRRVLPQLLVDDDGPAGRPEIEDDRLRLVFTCCHPALSPDAQVALTLRLVCGLSTGEVARAFLVQEPTMAARITRAKKKIATARIPYRVPPRAELPDRLRPVLDVVYLVFTTGHAAAQGEELLREDLLERAVALGRLLHELLPDEPSVDGLLALMLFVDARRRTRVGPGGRLLLLKEQDRSRWDRVAIDEAGDLLTRALARGPVDRYAVEAALAGVHAEAPDWAATDWDEIVRLYDVLLALHPTPVVALNRAVAVGLRDGPLAGLRAVEPLLDEPALAGYPYLAATRADFLRRLGRDDEAAGAYEEAAMLSGNDAERAFLLDRLDELR